MAPRHTTLPYNIGGPLVTAICVGRRAVAMKLQLRRRSSSRSICGLRTYVIWEVANAAYATAA